MSKDRQRDEEEGEEPPEPALGPMGYGILGIFTLLGGGVCVGTLAAQRGA